MQRLLIYTDTSVIGGCQDPEFSTDSLTLWTQFVQGAHTLVLSAHTLRELLPAPQPVRQRLLEVPEAHQIVLADSLEVDELANAYLQRGIVGQGSRSDAIHVALATIGRADVLVSWNFKHIVNLGRIRLFNDVNLELGDGTLEIRTPTVAQRSSRRPPPRRLPTSARRNVIYQCHWAPAGTARVPPRWKLAGRRGVAERSQQD